MSRVLVVEDDSRIASIIAKGLRSDNHEVVVAEDGHLGLFLAYADDVDLVVLDLGLPGLPGRALLDALSVERDRLPVVVVTGHDSPEERADCLAAGARAYLTKPFSMARLQAEVTAQLAAVKESP